MAFTVEVNRGVIEIREWRKGALSRSGGYVRVIQEAGVCRGDRACKVLGL